MCSRRIAGLFSLLLLASSVEAAQGRSAFTIEYPIRQYRVVEGDLHQKERSREVRNLARELSLELSLQFTKGDSPQIVQSEVTGLRVRRPVSPIRLIWNDPRYFFRTPAVLEWIELVDERGRVVRVWVTASNQSRPDDMRIIGWCTNDALWQPSEIEGGSAQELRSAGVTLVASPFNYAFWIHWATTRNGLIALAVLAAVVAWLLNRISTFRKERQMRHDALMSRIHRSTPFKPPSIKDEM